MATLSNSLLPSLTCKILSMSIVELCNKANVFTESQDNGNNKI